MKKAVKFIQNNYIYLIALFIMGAAWGPYLICALYALPCSDDYGTANDMVSLGGHSIGNIFRYVKQIYFSWQGTYSGEIFSAFFDPLGRKGTVGVSYFLFGLNILFFACIGLLFYEIFQLHKGVSGQRAFLLMSVCIMMCLNSRILTQMLFWFVGAAEYTIPFLAGICGIICLAVSFKKEEEKQKRLFVFLSAFLGFISCGGILQVSGYICFIFFVCVCYSIYKHKSIGIYMCSFLITISGALINVAAPGNYVRKDAIDRSISVFTAAFYSILAVLEEVKYLFTSSYLPWLLLLLLLLDLFLLPVVQEKLYHPVVVGVLVIISWLVSTFPVCYGYGSSALMDRGKELLDVIIVIGLCFFINSLINWLKKKGFTLKKDSLLVLLSLSLIYIGYQQSEMPISGMPSAVCFSEIVSGNIKEYHTEWEKVLKIIETEEEPVVVVPVYQSIYERNRVVRSPGLTDSFEDWHNAAIAAFYGKEAVRVEVQNDREAE